MIALAGIRTPSFMGGRKSQLAKPLFSASHRSGSAGRPGRRNHPTFDANPHFDLKRGAVVLGLDRVRKA